MFKFVAPLPILKRGALAAIKEGDAARKIKDAEHAVA